MKICSKSLSNNCKAESNPQPLANFAKDRKRKDGLTVHCKSCLKHHRDVNKESRNKVIKEWHKNNPDKVKQSRAKSSAKNSERTRLWRLKNQDSLLISRYGITKEDYNLMFEKQNGNCAICCKHQSLFKKSLHVDHCHSTNRVRGLLCSKCNQAIGLFKDSQESMLRACKYLMGGI